MPAAQGTVIHQVPTATLTPTHPVAPSVTAATSSGIPSAPYFETHYCGLLTLYILCMALCQLTQGMVFFVSLFYTYLLFYCEINYFAVCGSSVPSISSLLRGPLACSLWHPLCPPFTRFSVQAAFCESHYHELHGSLCRLHKVR